MSSTLSQTGSEGRNFLKGRKRDFNTLQHPKQWNNLILNLFTCKINSKINKESELNRVGSVNAHFNII